MKPTPPRISPYLPFLIGSFVWVSSCGGGEPGKGGNADEGEVGLEDDDRDGFSGEEDCNDADPAIHADAAEICDGVDNNCDGVVDEGVMTAWYTDEDGDGFGDADHPVESCSPDEGIVSNDTDCDDGLDSVYPGAFDWCDGLDNDCDGDIDEAETTTWYADEDGDGFGDAAAWVEACESPEGYTSDDEDCDDTTETAFPGATEVCDEIDNDCDGAIDEAVTSTFYEDRDGDHWGVLDETTEACSRPTGYAPDAGDCDDNDIAYNPGESELDCTDPHDYNCDGSVGYADADADGWPACEDCNDADGLVSLDGTEVCNSIDDDCDSLVDDADPTVDSSTGTLWYADIDGDGYGDLLAPVTSCTMPSGYVANSLDCDDRDSLVSPSATEICNGIDDDCDGSLDDDDASVDLSTGIVTYADTDGDGFGDPGTSLSTCDLSAGFVTNDSDCDDTDILVNPSAVEICNGIDDDCDLAVDDADGSLSVGSTGTWYQDSDGDGYGGASVSVKTCTAPTGYVSSSSDCNDSAAAVNPGASEVCNSIDDDCDSLTDDADTSLDKSTGSTWYRDADGDLYGLSTSSTMACTKPTGYVSLFTDCDDSAAAVNPAASEVCNSIDDDCDTLIDDTDTSLDTSTGSTWYRDADSDGYGVSSTTKKACALPSGYSTTTTDCNDGAVAISPAATEVCDAVDNDCDSNIDEGFDADGDTITDCQEINHTVVMYYAVDDASTGYVDGTSIGSSGGWSTVYTWTGTLNSGDHVIAMYGYDTGAAIAGFLAAVYIDGSLYSTTGDSKWKVNSSGPTGWTDASYNDGAWGTGTACTTAQMSAYWGGAPASLRATGASWIWSQNCVSLGSGYFRLNLTLP